MAADRWRQPMNFDASTSESFNKAARGVLQAIFGGTAIGAAYDNFVDMCAMGATPVADRSCARLHGGASKQQDVLGGR